jgi:hypothetical protein
MLVLRMTERIVSTHDDAVVVTDVGGMRTSSVEVGFAALTVSV